MSKHHPQALTIDKLLKTVGLTHTITDIQRQTLDMMIGLVAHNMLTYETAEECQLEQRRPG